MKRVLVAWLLVCCMLVAAAPVVTAADGKIDINSASAEELTQLNKVGPKIAERIVSYRNANGPFKTIDDLRNVKGVGDKILELNRDRISIGQS